MTNENDFTVPCLGSGKSLNMINNLGESNTKGLSKKWYGLVDNAQYGVYFRSYMQQHGIKNGSAYCIFS
jgi:hypothetical protein